VIKTKIIATIGPACESEETIGKMIDAGMSAARFNMSHGTQGQHRERLLTLRRVEKEKDLIVSKIMDLRGPDIRVGQIEDGVLLEEGKTFTLIEEDLLGNKERASVLIEGLGRVLTPGAKILVDDGKIALFVKKVGGKEIVCTVMRGGPLLSNKSITTPSVDVPLPFLSAKDLGDITFCIDNRMDYIAASFTKTAENILDLQRHMVGTRCGIIAKIEHPRAIENIDDIIAVSDGIMVARGDLGVEIAPETVPLIQKEIIDRCNMAGKPVITATQMLESMVASPLPTRAETSDVANAILDGTDAIMLSEETAVGRYPVESVLMMARIAQKTEARLKRKEFPKKKAVRAAVCHSTFEASVDLDARAIIAPTSTGNTARLMSQFRPSCPIIALTTRETAGKLALFWGVFPYVFDFKDSTDEMVASAIENAKHSGMIHEGDLVIITGGIPSGKGNPTNMMKVHRLGEELF
jgi:pyruvate kinase